MQEASEGSLQSTVRADLALSRSGGAVREGEITTPQTRVVGEVLGVYFKGRSGEDKET